MSVGTSASSMAEERGGGLVVAERVVDWEGLNAAGAGVADTQHYSVKEPILLGGLMFQGLHQMPRDLTR